MRWMGCWWRWHHGGKWCQRSISAHFNALARRTDRWYLLGSESAKCFVYQVRMGRHHVFPADGLHHVCGVTAARAKQKIGKINKSFWRVLNSRKLTCWWSRLYALSAGLHCEDRRVSAFRLPYLLTDWRIALLRTSLWASRERTVKRFKVLETGQDWNFHSFSHLISCSN